MRIAVIDHGTNTCNLLIADISGTDFSVIHQSKQLVKLGDNKIVKNQISQEAIQRTISAFRIHNKIIHEYKVDKVEVIATSAVRSAENKKNFLEQITNETGWQTQVISGEKEAELIFKGVLLAFGQIENPAVILDIGGGSNELILLQKKEMLWKESRPTGMSRIINNFQLSDPIKANEIEILKNHFAEGHKNAFKKCSEHAVRTLIGCSGAFDTIADMIDNVEPGEKQRITQEILLHDFYAVYNKLIPSTREDRLQMKGMDMVRVDLIVPAVILIEQLITELGLKKIVQTDFALREGVLFDRILN